MAALTRLCRRAQVSLVICSGDLTVLGTSAELEVSREALAPLSEVDHGIMVVPGNHDLYLPDTVRERRFEAFFGDWMVNDLPEYSVDGVWPQVRLIDESLALVAINSARPNPAWWRSTGRVPDDQLHALARVLSDRRVQSRFVFVVTHYALRRPGGRRDTLLHRLDNADELLAVCGRIDRGAILHGHIHQCYRARLPGISASSFCAGSTTESHHEGLWLFEVRGRSAVARRGYWADGDYHLLRQQEQVCDEHQGV